MAGLRETGATRLLSARSPAHAATRSSLGGLTLVLAAWVLGCGEEPPPAPPVPPVANPVPDSGPGLSAPVVDAGGLVPGQPGTDAAVSGVSPAGGSPDAAADAGSAVASDAGLPEGSVADAAAPPPTPATRRTLVDPYTWEVLGADEDPFDDRPQEIFSCDPQNGVKVEDLMGQDTFEVNTGFCRYATARQATLADVAAGETLKVRIWHYSLTGPDGSQAHVVLQVGEQRVVEEMFPIPGPGGLTAIELPVEEALPAGTPVYFHVHNHGENTYSMVELTGGPAT